MEEKSTSLPPQAVLYQMAVAHYLPRALYVAVKRGIPDLLRDGPRSAGDLAAATRTDPDALRRVLRLLVSVGVFDESEEGTFALTELSQALRSDVPWSARNAVLLFAGTRIQDAWRDLEHCVETGEPAFRKRGLDDPFAEMAADPETSAVFDAAMADFTRLVATTLAATYDFSGLRTLVDVGGGSGALLIGVLQAHGHLKGVVHDQPHAVERARRAIEDAGLATRCTAVAGDFFASVPEGGDAYLLKHVIHDWDDARASAILRTCRRAMRDDARLLLVESVYPSRVDRSLASRGATANDVNMLVNTGGRQRTEGELRALYDAAGFALVRVVPLPGGPSVVEGAPR